jgi:GrpB-like predicted nucleotidyltransferase (UPF0157 family)
MVKELRALSLEELWQLFPIELVPYSENYPLWYQEEAKTIKSILSEHIVRINHIGSTAVKNLTAKPIVDILLEVDEESDVKTLRKALKSIGWQLMHEEEQPFNDVFHKGYTKYGFAEKVFHLHVRFEGDYDELYFRDYLRSNEEARKQYVKLKKELAVRYKHHRENYTNAKTDFIKECTKKAREEVGS